jgi:Fungalysin metallopeptidase (M36)
MGEYALRLKAGKFIGRNLNNHKRFPQDVIRPGLNASEPHYTSLIASGAWWDVEQKTGSFDAQQLIFKSLSLLPSREIDFFDFRDAMLAADENLNDGKNRDTIKAAFDRHGLSGEDPGQTGVATVTSLKTARWNLNTGVKRITQSFKKGQYVLGVIGYNTSSNLIPGYNFVPVDAELSAPCNSCVTVVTFPDEARKGTHANADGAIQVLLITRSAVSGTYTLTVKSRLGGTEQVSNTVTANFRIR